MTSTSKSMTKARSALPILQGVLPLDPARVPLDVIAGATLAALAIPEVMGYTKIAGMPVVTGLYTLLLPVLLFAIFGSSRHLVVGADFGHGGDPGDRPGRDRRGRGYAPVHGAGRSGGADVRRHPPRRPAPAARVHRQLPVAQRAHRVPHRRRHPGRDGPGGGHVRGRRRQRHDAREVRQLAPRDRRRRHRHRDAGGVDRRPRDHRRARRGQQEDPGGAHRRRRFDRAQQGPRPAGQGRHDARTDPGRASRHRAAAGRHHHRQHRRPAADGHLAVRGDPRPERGDVACLRHEVRRQLRGERGPGRPRPGQSRGRGERDLSRQRQPDQDRDGRQRRRPQPGIAADRRERSWWSSCCS